MELRVNGELQEKLPYFFLLLQVIMGHDLENPPCGW